MKKDLLSIVSVNRAKPLGINSEIPTQKQIMDVLRSRDPLEKAVVLVAASSGLTANQIVNLRVHHFKCGFDPQTGMTILRLCRQSTGAKFVTFLTPEGSRAVIDYLDYRDYRQKWRVLSDDGYLFVKRKISDEFVETGDEELRKMNERTLMMIYRRIAEMVQKNSPQGNRIIFKPHSVRKFFYAALINHGSSMSDLEILMGHPINGTE